MNTRKLALFVVIAGAIALIITFGIYKHNQSSHDAYVVSKHAYQYLAAARDIADGDRIGPDDLIVANWTSDQPVVGAYGADDKAKVIGRIVSYPMSNGMLITEKYLAGPDSSLGLPHKIPPGMRAISIRTDDVSDLGGFLFPGVKVDILAALKNEGEARSVAIVQNVTVLATGKQMTPDPSGKPTTVSIVTVLVTPEQAGKVALAQQEGALYISLRNGSDDEVLAAKPSLLSDIAGIAAPEKQRPLGANPPFPPPGTAVETILGDSSSTQFFRNNVPVSAGYTPAPARQPYSGDAGYTPAPAQPNIQARPYNGDRP